MQWLGGLLEEAKKAAPVLLGQLSQAPTNQPAGYQPPGSSNEIIMSQDGRGGNAKAAQFSDNGGQVSHDRYDRYDSHNDNNDRPHPSCSSFATDVDGGYTGEDDRPHVFGAGFGARRENGGSFSPQRQAGPPIVADVDQGLVTSPNGVGFRCGGNTDIDGPYDAYANANLNGPYEDVPPTTNCLSMPPEHFGAHPSCPYPAAPGGFQSPPPTTPGGGEAYASARCYSPPGTTPCGGYSPPGTAGGDWLALGHTTTLPSSSSPSRGAPTDDFRQREAWAPGSIVEVFSSSAGSWNVARVIKVGAGDMGGEVLTVQFMADDGPKQKCLSRNDRQVAVLGARGMPELPPGFQVRTSQSRPGQQVFLDATTGKKYASLELAWSLHFERLAQSASCTGLERTVAGPALRRLHGDAEAPGPSPIGTYGASFSAGSDGPVGPQMPRSHGHLLTEGALVPSSCRSEGPPAMSLAELMNMKAVGAPSPANSHYEFSSGQPSPHQPTDWGNPANPYQPMHSQHSQYSQRPPAHSAPGIPPLPSMGMSRMPTMGEKISLPSFGSRPSTDSQAAYLQHEAAYLHALVERSSEAAYPDRGVEQAPSAPFAGGSSAAQGGESFGGMYGSGPGHDAAPSHAPSVPRRAPWEPVRAQVNPEMQSWQEDPFSQWRR